MHSIRRPHLLGIDDGPFEKDAGEEVMIVGVMMEAADLVEAVAHCTFPVDGAGVTGFLADWISQLRFRPALHAVVLGGVTIAGLAVIDIHDLSARLELPVLVVNRRDPRQHRLGRALESAGLAERIEIVERTPEAFPLGDRLFVAAEGLEPSAACALIRAAQHKSELPEPLRLAHLIASAVATGESRGRP